MISKKFFHIIHIKKVWKLGIIQGKKKNECFVEL